MYIVHNVSNNVNSRGRRVDSILLDAYLLQECFQLMRLVARWALMISFLLEEKRDQHSAKVLRHPMDIAEGMRTGRPL